MSERERVEHSRLLRKWATGKASQKEMMRCMELDRKADAERASPPTGDGR
jgi:hypothetical protein